MFRRLLAISAFLTLLAAAVAADAAPPPGTGGPPSGGGPPGGGDTADFEVSGSVSGLLPGLEIALPLKIENPFNFEILIEALEVTADDAAPLCTSDNMEVTDPPLPILVSANAEVTVHATLALRSDAANECQGETFQLTYHAEATRP